MWLAEKNCGEICLDLCLVSFQVLSSEGLKLSIYCQLVTGKNRVKIISRVEGMEFQDFFSLLISVMWFISLFNEASCSYVELIYFIISRSFCCFSSI